MLSTNNLQYRYTKGSELFEFPNLNVNKAESLLILGKSGVGKSTLLHILGGLLPPSDGDVSIDNQSIYNLGQQKLDKFRGQNIGIVFQKPHFVKSISAVENLLVAQQFASGANNKDYAIQVLDRLGIYNRSNASVNAMSQGELQRLSIARALINNPKLILADEPTSALDDHNCQVVYEMLEQQSKEENAALVIVTHDQRLKVQVSNFIEL